MNLGDLIDDLERLAQEHGRDAEVIVTTNGRRQERGQNIVVGYDEDDGGVVIDTLDE